MARFLSPEWFAELAKQSAAQVGAVPSRPELVVEIAVAGAPGDNGPGRALSPGLGGEAGLSGGPRSTVRYQLVVEGERVVAVAPGEASRSPTLCLATDYATAAGIASGRLSASDALSSGRAKVSGDASSLHTLAGHLADLDLLPPALRAATTF